MFNKHIVLSDIFGRTGALEKFVDALPFSSIIVDPYNGKKMTFADEQQAYQYFTEHVGLEGYTEKLHQVLLNTNYNVQLIGFSVGASIIWRISDRHYEGIIQNAFLFYGSQIRHSLDIEPTFAVNVICPIKERHFDITAFKLAITDKNKVNIIQSHYLHGFMNECSTNFDLEGYRKFKQFIVKYSTDPNIISGI
ncbi:hypothetical protein [Thalassotalea hakodatensis]|uniref:hypothetical protein n=1 Tax=Thalassotalea hakodatensis TaxID=3030492 RepID=UPI0025744BC9|nr:hypothetical protein [Thalassotalea hakodatensis]